MKIQFFIIPVVSMLLIACERHDKPTTPQPPQTSFMDQDYTSDDARDSSASAIYGQTDNSTDQTLAQRVRQAIMSDDSLSANAKNIRITASNGIITLRGMVSSNRERETISNRANNIQGVKRIDNQIEVMRGNY